MCSRVLLTLNIPIRVVSYTEHVVHTAMPDPGRGIKNHDHRPPLVYSCLQVCGNQFTCNGSIEFELMPFVLGVGGPLSRISNQLPDLAKTRFIMLTVSVPYYAPVPPSSRSSSFATRCSQDTPPSATDSDCPTAAASSSPTTDQRACDLPRNSSTHNRNSPAWGSPAAPPSARGISRDPRLCPHIPRADRPDSPAAGIATDIRRRAARGNSAAIARGCQTDHYPVSPSPRTVSAASRCSARGNTWPRSRRTGTPSGNTAAWILGGCCAPSRGISEDRCPGVLRAACRVRAGCRRS